ncbi:MAG: hypothetical protein R2753_02255 [Chitinophagales bacterium]
MNKFTFLLIAIVMLLASCKDKSAPVFSSFLINGAPVDQVAGVYSGSFNDTAVVDMIIQDDEELFQFIAFIDTTGVGDNERLYAESLTGKEDFVRMTYTFKALDSLSQLYFFGNAVPVNFTAIDNNQNTSSIIVNFTVQ